MIYTQGITASFVGNKQILVWFWSRSVAYGVRNESDMNESMACETDEDSTTKVRYLGEGLAIASPDATRPLTTFFSMTAWIFYTIQSQRYGYHTASKASSLAITP